MAEIWRGRADDDAVVCIKRLDPPLSSDPDFVEMFRDEARLVLGLDHDNVVKTFALYDDNPGGQPRELLLVMELVDGKSLARLQRALQQQPGASPPTLAESLTIALRLARALEHVHACDDDGAALAIVHRDISPQNVLIDRSGRLVLIDFGVAHASSRLTLTRKGLLKGKAAYMAPEQVRGQAVDARVDQFAAGVVLWELLCQRSLFAGNNEQQVLARIERADVTAPSVVVPLDARVARRVDALVLKSLCFEPEQRFADMAAFARAVEDILDDVGGAVDLAPLVRRGLAAIDAVGRSSEQPTRTRVLQAPDDAAAADGRPPSLRAWLFGVLVILLGLAVSSGRGPSRVDVSSIANPAATLEDRLHAAPSHPCRTELLDELLDPSRLIDDIAADVDGCVVVAVAAPALLASLERRGLLQAPPLRKNATPQQRVERLDELSRRARLALDAGRSDVARALLEEVVSADPARIDDRRSLAEAYRRDGAPALAAVELRAFLAARPQSPERVRLQRWMTRNNLPL